MNYQIIKALSLLSAGAGIIACDSSESDKPERPNVIIIMTDDQGWGDLSLTGNTNLHTPNIDKLAQEGAQFNNFYVSPVCSPTRAELLTGRYHRRSGVTDTSEGFERLNLDETTVAEVFKEAGYSTATFGKWHNGMQYPYHPNGRGFDEFYGFCSGHWGDYFSPPLEHNGKIVKGEGYVPDDITGKALEFMEQNRNNPFFLYIAQITPHRPMQVTDEWWDRFKDKDLELFSDERYSEDIDQTRVALAMCENIDWNVGRVSDKLEELGIQDNTIIIFLSDNGPNYYRWNGGMKGRKGSTDEGGVKSPLVVRWPGQIKAGLVIDEIAAIIDFLPTLAEMAGIEYKTLHPVDGISLKPLLLESDYEWQERLIFSHWGNRTSVRSQNFRLDHQGQLFNMVEDPGQYRDISNETPEVKRQLLQAVEEWKNEVIPPGEPEKRPFTVGHPNTKYTQLPARDGQAEGGIVRSNQWPNSSFYTNWTSLDDKIIWDVEVLADGYFDVEIYYTCPPQDVGSVFELSFESSSTITGEITEGHDPPLRGMENDRVPRGNSYVKDFKPLKIGKVFLERGKGRLTLQATKIPGSQVMDFRTMMLTRTD